MKTTNSFTGWLSRATLILLTLALTGSFAHAQDRHRIEQVSSLYDYWSEIVDIATEDNRAYVAVDARGLIVADYADPENPEQIGSFQVNGDGLDLVAVKNDIAYTVWWHGMVRVLDVSNPAEIVELASFQLQPFYRASELICSEGLLFIGLESPNEQVHGPLYIYNVEDPERPEVLSAFVPPDENVQRLSGRGVAAFDVEGEFVYLSNQHSDLFALRITDPENPEIVATTIGKISQVQNRRIYMGSGNIEHPIIKIVDFNGRDQFDEIAEYESPDPAYDLAISGNTLFLSLTSRTLLALNVENIEDIREAGSIRTRYLTTLAIEGDRLFGGSGNRKEGLFYIDVADPANMRIVSQLDHHGAANKIEKVGDLALLSGYNAGLRFIDVSDPEEPRVLGVYDGERFVYNFAILGRRAYVMDTYSIRVVNFEDPANPVEVSVVNDQSADAVAISGEYLFTVGNSPGLSVYDIEDPDHPQLVVHSRVISVVRSIEAKDDRLFIPDFDGVRVFDVSDPEAGIEELPLIENEANGSPWVKIIGNYLFFGGGSFWADGDQRDGFLTIIDIEDIDQPRVLSRITPRNFGAWDVDIAGNMMFVAAGPGGISLYDISNPVEPEEIGWFDTYGTAFGVDLDGAFGYVADYQSLGIYDLSEAIDLYRHPFWSIFPEEIITVSEGEIVEFNVSVRADEDLVVDPIAETFPNGAFLDDQGGGTLTFIWQTNFQSSGEYEVALIASNGELNDTLRIAVTVNNVNRPPFLNHFGQLEPPDSSALPDGDTIRFVWSSATDPDDDHIIYTLLLEGYRDHYYFNAGGDTTREVRRRDLLALMGDSLQAINWRVMATDGTDTAFTDSSFALLPPLSAPNDLLLPSSLSVTSFPNPFNSSVTISFSAEGQASLPVKLAIYDINGREVADLTDRNVCPPHSKIQNLNSKVTWDAGSVGAGVYFVKLVAGEEVRTQKIILIR